MIRNIKFLFILVVVFFLVSLVSYLSAINSSADKKGSDVVFVVESGQGVNEISKNLFDAGLIKSKFYFETYIWLNKKESSLQAGKYVLNPILNIKEIVDIFVKGEVNNSEMTVKIIEGWSARDIAAYLEKTKKISEEDFLGIVGSPMVDYRKKGNAPKDFSGEYDFLADKPDYYGLEGYLFPDTYRIYEDASAEDIVKKMLDNFDKKLTKEMRTEIKRQGKTIYEIITMASLVEKEVRSKEDMKTVAGIFWDRIKNGQALESCATLAYILGVNKSQYTLEDTKINSPYNTYRNKDLMPGPISNPGISAIEAAIYPEYTDYNYFLTDLKTGKTIFSKTYEEHVKNKAKYLN